MVESIVNLIHEDGGSWRRSSYVGRPVVDSTSLRSSSGEALRWSTEVEWLSVRHGCAIQIRCVRRGTSMACLGCML